MMLIIVAVNTESAQTALDVIQRATIAINVLHFIFVFLNLSERDLSFAVTQREEWLGVLLIGETSNRLDAVGFCQA
jgi:hypothetical protein